MKIGDFRLTHNQKEKLVLIHSGLLSLDAKLSVQVMQKLIDYKLVSDSYVVTPLGIEYVEVLLKKKPGYFDAAKKRFIVKTAKLSFDMKNLLGGITDGSIEKGGAGFKDRIASCLIARELLDGNCELTPKGREVGDAVLFLKREEAKCNEARPDFTFDAQEKKSICFKYSEEEAIRILQSSLEVLLSELFIHRKQIEDNRIEKPKFIFRQFADGLNDTPVDEFLDSIKDPVEFAFKNAIRAIGKKIFIVGGPDAMSNVSDEVCTKPLLCFGHYEPHSDFQKQADVLAWAWDGIGGWYA